MCLTIHPTARNSLPVISNFSYTSINSISVLRMTETEMVVTQWFQCQAADFDNKGIQKSVPRYDKCLNSGGEYDEK
jgi:hypothetical protein